MRLLDTLFRSRAIERVFSERACLQRMLDFEGALARAEERAGLIPSTAASAITAQCHSEFFDLDAMGQGAALAGNLAIPLVKQLTALVEKSDIEAARFVHWGATSQDAIDTGSVLQLRDALEIISEELARISGVIAQLARKYRSTLIVGRTWMQQALPTTFGMKAAGWLDALNRNRTRLTELRERVLVLQFGGAVGTLAALHTKGLQIATSLAEELQLKLPDIPWHSHRDRTVEAAVTLGLLTGTLGKIARDITLHMQTEVGEIYEPSGPGRGGSSTLPHKRNPVTSAVVLAAATRVPGLVSTMLAAMTQEHERGVGGWHAEWESLPEIVSLTGGALHHLADTLAALEIDTAKMQQNLESTGGLIFAEAIAMSLSDKLGRLKAHEKVREASQRAQNEHRHLREVLSEDVVVMKQLSNADLERLFEAKNYLGAAEEFVDRVISSYRADVPKMSGNG